MVGRGSISAIDRALQAWRRGDSGAVDELFELVYHELRGLARRQMTRGAVTPSFTPTALVHEVYLRFAEQTAGPVDREHFTALAARAMRQIITDHVRRKRAGKRRPEVSLSTGLDDPATTDAALDVDVLALDRALTRLAALDARQAQIVELRYFGGLTTEEVARVTGLSSRTVKREWQKARTFLYYALHAE